jgi:hypothetical protein
MKAVNPGRRHLTPKQVSPKPVDAGSYALRDGEVQVIAGPRPPELI